MSRLFSFFYEILLYILGLFFFPFFCYAYFIKGKYRKSILHRFGWRFPSFSHPSIWIHAISVGETKAVAELAKQIKQRFPKYPLIISSVTETGHEEARRSLAFADAHVYFPLDFQWVVKNVLKRANPALVLICESDFWFNFLDTAKKQGALIALVNGKLSEKSFKRFQFFSYFSRKLFNFFDAIVTQNTSYQMHFEKIGIPSEKISVSGNLKFDHAFPSLEEKEKQNWKEKLGIPSSAITIVLASTHKPEEDYLAEILKSLSQRYSHLHFLIVPRHPERFTEVGKILEKKKILYVRLSDLSVATEKEKVVLIDRMGILLPCYQIADLAIVGGSFFKGIGGHNILEPIQYGLPVFFGPFMNNQSEMAQLIEKAEAGYSSEINQLENLLALFIEQTDKRKETGERGKLLIKKIKGSVEKTLTSLSPIFHRLKEN